jgi:hypothetical protein
MASIIISNSLFIRKYLLSPIIDISELAAIIAAVDIRKMMKTVTGAKAV